MTPTPLTPQQPARGGAPYTRTAIHMDTLIAIEVVRAPALPAAEAAVERALAWFRRVEEACSRFDPHSELRRLVGRVGEPTPVSELLYEALAFALAVARASGGAFDPTIGHRLERLGFDRNYRTGEAVASPVDPAARPSYRDVRLDPAR